VKTVKTFGNFSEAGFASSLLEAAGVRASLADEQSSLMTLGMATDCRPNGAKVTTRRLIYRDGVLRGWITAAEMNPRRGNSGLGRRRRGCFFSGSCRKSP
jgi:hypothetical protein